MSGLVRKIRAKLSSGLIRLSDLLYPERKFGQVEVIKNVGADQLPANAKRALVNYVINAIPYYIKGNPEEFQHINPHSMFWESIELVRTLNHYGYIVDYYNSSTKAYNIRWEDYDLIIDERDLLKDIPAHIKAKKVHYSTGCYWLYQNKEELKRIDMFQRRTNSIVYPHRQAQAISSHVYADVITSFGNDHHKGSFPPVKASFHDLDISISSHQIPVYKKKDLEGKTKSYLWIGGSGAIHKGLDLVVDAFIPLKDKQLFIVGSADQEPLVWAWLEPILKKHEHIKFSGFLDVNTDKFKMIADECIGVIYPSASEGGPGAIAQALHHGLIPIVTHSSNVRAEDLGYKIQGESDVEIMASIKDKVKQMDELSPTALKEKSDAVRAYAQQRHTRQAYSKSIDALIKQFI